MSRSRPQGRPRRQNGGGSRMPWKGTWGPLSDGRSKVSRLAREIEGELVREHKPTTPRQRRLLRRAAKLEALAERVSETLDRDPKSTRRALTALEGAADRKIAQVRAAGNGHGQGEDLGAALVELHREDEA